MTIVYCFCCYPILVLGCLGSSHHSHDDGVDVCDFLLDEDDEDDEDDDDDDDDNDVDDHIHIYIIYIYKQ